MACVGTVNVGEVTQSLTIKVRGVKSLAVRTWLCGLLIRFAAWVLGTKLSVELVDGIDFDDRELPPAFDGSPYRQYVRVGGYSVPTACSVDESSPLHDAGFLEWGPHVEVVLDGAVQSKVVAFDTKGGWVRRYKLNEAGDPYIAGDRVATEVLRGKVELRPA